MWFLLVLLGIIALIYFLTRGSSNNVIPPPQDLSQQWVDFIAAYRPLAKNKSERAMIERMLTDLLAQGLPGPTITDQYVNPPPQVEAVGEATTDMAAQPVAQPTYSMQSTVAQQPYIAASDIPTQEALREKLDNTSLLLYFGAFLFLASAGLFVALSGAYGELRVATVLVVMAALYYGGFWLHDNKPKLRTAGRTFIGMGLMLAPLVGLALYSYVMKDQPQLVWLLTSVLCLALYGNALQRLKSQLMEYVFIGTFLSLFESAISVTQLPLYYYGWGFAVVGLLLHGWHLFRGQPASEEVDESPTVLSAGVLMPLSAMTALYMVPKYGVIQLGVSLVLTAVYYALQAWEATSEDSKVNNALVAQSASLAAIGSFTFAVHHSYSEVGLVLLVCGVLQLLFILARKASAILRASAMVLIVSLGIAVFLGWEKPWLMTITVLGLSMSAVALWVKQQRPGMYCIGMAAILTLPYILGWHVAETQWHAAQIAIAAFIASAAPLFSFMVVRQKTLDTIEWRDGWRLVQALSLFAGIAATIFSGELHVLLASFGVAGLSYGLSRLDVSYASWLQLSSALTLVPLFFTRPDRTLWLVSVSTVFLWNLMLTLAARLEAARWVGSLAWALLPLGIARQFTALNTPEWYAASYFVITAGFVLARAIAKRRISHLPITLSELEQRLHTDSQAYVLGYGIAAFASYVTSLAAVYWLPATIGTGLAILFTFIAMRVEKLPSLMTVVPLLLQAALWGTFDSGKSMTAYVLISSGFGLLSYASTWVFAPNRIDYAGYTKYAAAITMYVAPATALFFEPVWAMPLTMFIAGLVTMHVAWLREQMHRELAGGVVVLAVMWFMYYHGVTNVQAYTHVIAAVFGLYAYWRGRRNDAVPSDQYLIAMLAAATIPLGIQVIASNSGGLYGWWFLGEQIAIMLLGMALKNRFVTRWGLYVAVGSVLFQLRALAWLSLTLLALFLIALAVYQLQKSDDKPSKNG